MQNNAPSFKGFLLAFGANWFTKMSGPLTVPFTLAALFVPSTWLKALFSALAIICGGAASWAVWAVERKKVGGLEDRISPKLDIPEVVYPQPLNNGEFTHYFDVVNISATTIDEVNAVVTDMEPPPKTAKWLLPLHIKGDNKKPPDRKCNLNPGEKAQFDLVNSPRGASFFWIVDVVVGTAGGDWTKVDWIDVPSGICTLTVTASGRDVIPATRKFSVYKDIAGYLRCVPFKPQQ